MANKRDPEEISILPSEQLLPNKLVLIPLQGRPIFPGIFTPLMISSPDDVKVIEKAYEEDGFIGIVMLKNDSETPSVADLQIFSFKNNERLQKKRFKAIICFNTLKR